MYRAWLTYAGAAAPDSLWPLFHAKPETYEQDGLFHLATRFWGQRTAVRYAPPEQTPFSLQASPSGVDLVLDGRVLERSSEILEPEASCLKNLAYYSDGVPRRRDASITINPIQSCPMRCSFCRRQYDQLGDQQGEDALLNLSPVDAARHLMATYELDWTSGIQIAIVTGTFATFEHMHRFTSEFAAAMAQLTDGAYDPHRERRQNIHLLTHLARTAEEMTALRDIGVKTLQNTAEIVSDRRRIELMPKANPRNTRLLGKGELSFPDVLAATRAGVTVLGEAHHFVTLILGLDTLQDTTRGLRELKQAGLRRLDRSNYQPFEARGLGLYAMSAAELIEANPRAADMFEKVTTNWDPDRLVAAASSRPT